ncbi:MAG: ECF-type sigma factor [Pirellulaceae bacterium]
MGLEDSMCEVVRRVKEGDDDAARRIWDEYFPQIVALAGRRLEGQRKQVADEEDVAISVMESFFRAARAGRFPDLQDRDGIWRLLARMTSRKVIDLIRKNAARPMLGESALDADAADGHPMASIANGQPTPQLITLVMEETQRLLDSLPEKYRAVAVRKLECYTAPEIAQQCGVHISTVERRLRIIRALWAEELGDADKPS